MRYRITYADSEFTNQNQSIVSTRSIQQAVAAAVRNDRYDREVVKVEVQPENEEDKIELARTLNRQQGAQY